MLGYVARCLHRFNHLWRKMQDSPHPWNKPAYGTHKQYADRDNSPYVNDEIKTLIHQILGSFLFYSRAVGPTMLWRNIRHNRQKKTRKISPTFSTTAQRTPMLPFVITKVTCNYGATPMQLTLSPKTPEVALWDTSTSVTVTDPKKPQANPTPNGPLHTEVAIIKNVVSSSTKAGIEGTFHNGKFVLICEQGLKKQTTHNQDQHL